MSISQTAALALLPDEVIQSILEYATPLTAVSLERVSRRFRQIANEPLLWKRYCLGTFRHWSGSHHIDEKLHSFGSVDWKQVFISRCGTAQDVNQTLDRIIESQTNRNGHFEAIARHGFDAKDTLLQNMHVDHKAPDHLARRYWSHAMLSSLHRGAALDAWIRVRQAPDSAPNLEAGLAAFNLFIRGGNAGGLSDVTDSLDRLARTIRAEYPQISRLRDRARACTIAEFLIRHRLVGINADREYHALQHNFIGLALSSEDHSSLPLISVAIYCALCARFDLKAIPCSYPYHVHAMIYPPQGYDLDGNSTAQDPVPMYMDPWRSAVEVPITSLQEQLSMLPNIDHNLPSETFLASSSPLEIALRCARNILNSIQQSNPRALTTANSIEDGEMRIDISSARYAALWSSVLLSSPPSSLTGFAAANFIHLHHELLTLLHLFANHFPNDIYLVQKHLLPMIEDLPGNYLNYLTSVRDMRQRDTVQRVPKLRSKYPRGHVKHRVGQVFKHKRYRYLAVIIGWDARCDAMEEWIETMGVDDLDGGREQSFYNALVLQDLSTRYVAAENIAILSPPETDDFFFDPTIPSTEEDVEAGDAEVLSDSSPHSSQSHQTPADEQVSEGRRRAGQEEEQQEQETREGTQQTTNTNKTDSPFSTTTTTTTTTVATAAATTTPTNPSTHTKIPPLLTDLSRIKELEQSNFPLQTGDFALEIGKYFRQWDRDHGVFISGMKDEYPED